MNIIEDIKKFKESKEKEANTSELIEGFITHFIEGKDANVIDSIFEGDYFGKVISIEPDYRWVMSSIPELEIEVAHDENKITIYDGNHQGFWVPPYINISKGHKDFDRLKESFVGFVLNAVGVKK